MLLHCFKSGSRYRVRTTSRFAKPANSSTTSRVEPGTARPSPDFPNLMTARHKLNGGAFLGALLVAGLIGGLKGSEIVFLIALVGLIVAGLIAGDIRP